MEQKSNNKNKAIGGRPPLDKMEKRTEILSFKCTVLERHIINGKAMTAGVTLGEYIRNTAINGNITARLTPEDVKLMKDTVGDEVKVKAAGGIRDWETCKKMIDAGAERIGTSNGVTICEEFSRQ